MLSHAVTVSDNDWYVKFIPVLTWEKNVWHMLLKLHLQLYSCNHTLNLTPNTPQTLYNALCSEYLGVSIVCVSVCARVCAFAGRCVRVGFLLTLSLSIFWWKNFLFNNTKLGTRTVWGGESSIQDKFCLINNSQPE